MAKKTPSHTLNRLHRPLSLVAQVEQALRRAVVEQIFPEGRLPTEVELAEQLGVSRETVRRAAETLQEEGLLRKFRRRGTLVGSAVPAVPALQPAPSRLLVYIQGVYHTGAQRREGVSDGLAGALLEGAAEEASHAEYDLIVRATTASALRGTLERLAARYRIAGVVAASFAEEKLLRKLGGRSWPVVLLDHDLALPKVSSIRDDSAAGSRQAVKHLIELGHRRIALVHWQQADLNPWRVRGYREALREARLPVRRQFEINTPITSEEAASVVRRLRAFEHPPTAIVCFNNTLARYVLAASESLGLSVPRTWSIVGCGGEEVWGLTTCQSDWRGMGRQAVSMLVRQLESPSGTQKLEHLQWTPELRPGVTSGPPPSRDRDDF